MAARMKLQETLPGTTLAPRVEDPLALMLEGLHRHVEGLTAEMTSSRRRAWQAGLSAADRGAFLEGKRLRLRRIVGADDVRRPSALSLRHGGPAGTRLARCGRITAVAVQWSVFDDLAGEGILLEPAGPARAAAVVLPDADQTPEALCGLDGGSGADAVALDLARRGCRVVVPALLDRRDTHSGLPDVRMTNQPHREFIYRAAYQLGRHILGLEAQVVSAALDWLAAPAALPTAVVGYGEGARVALLAAALDARVGTVLISGGFGPAEGLWEEPVYRNVFSFLRDFGDAETTALIAPRNVLIEACAWPAVDGPPPVREGRAGAAPGRLVTPSFEAVHAEWQDACRLWALAAPGEPSPALIGDGHGGPWSRATRTALAEGLGLGPPRGPADWSTAAPGESPSDRQDRLFRSMLGVTQRWLREAEFRRAAMWAPAEPPREDTWRGLRADYHRRFWEDVIGKLPPADRPPRPRTRLIETTAAWTRHEVWLDLWENAIAYGQLLVPRDLAPGERRPVVVCQHGLEGRPEDLIDERAPPNAYRRFAARLAERGFVVFVPQSPFAGGDRFRSLQRRLNPLGFSLFSVIARQHEVALRWLAELPWVDPERIGFYGISYGGKTAMRVPALLPGYCLSICSADFNEWIWKTASAYHRYSYLLTGEYEIFEFDLGNTFNHADMARLIFPRPFMVERGHHDGVAPDEWVGYEFARAFRFYDLMGQRQAIEIEVFDGPHAIHGEGTFAFLHRHLRWPEPPAAP